LATVDDEQKPQASMVAYAVEPGLEAIWLHLSRLAAHTGYLLNNGNVSLVISEQDPGSGDPQTLARISLTGRIQPVNPESQAFAQGKALYLQRFPAAEQRFGFGDFILLRMEPLTVRYVGGFGRAKSFLASGLAETAK
jgi:putative heme iron utilization protein